VAAQEQTVEQGRLALGRERVEILLEREGVARRGGRNRDCDATGHKTEV
jgi:hypothetical protein